MSDRKRPVNSINRSIIEELSLTPLDERLDLSPIGVLDLLVAGAEILDASRDDDGDACPSDNTCSDKLQCQCNFNSDTKCTVENR